MTGGDPAGIGPEIFLGSLPEILKKHPIIYINTAGAQHARECVRIAEGVHVRTLVVSSESLREAGSGLTILDLPEQERVVPGIPGRESGRRALAALEAACIWIKQRGTKALVTMPLSKHHVSLSHPAFRGHTDYLADEFSSKVIMLMHGKALSVIPLTVHVPLSHVPAELHARMNDADLIRILKILHGWKEYSGTRWALCGLNPHAGENGLLGREEIDFMNIIADRWRAEGLPIEGPLPADGIFQEYHHGRYRLVLSAYHDQGLAPFKALEGRAGVNCTIGLPFVRTSPDHGTAFEIAGKGVADSASFAAAFELAQASEPLWI
ncbi:MAG TPA: 4-hydroxythreonine-4-phosphate dehydrogenase PdxA [Leptospiraceae bacterium]|nr:4-hydroxythreonine-4-phosphate dehydrogenase PdxA [Leptospiraceae bacterium]HNL01639.1 4-hydroxythreonine-4-phosphate dehydrogenase PdxA [Leptospiraceae bacterium]